MPASLPINEQLWTAGQLVVRARIFLDIWWTYEAADSRPPLLPSMQQYPDFFRFDSHAHLVSFIIHIAALFEDNRRTVNFHRLLKELRPSLPTSDQHLKEAELRLGRAKLLTKKIAVLRNNLFAHRSASVGYSDAFRTAAITPDQLHHVADEALVIVNSLLAAKGLQPQFFNELPAQHLREVIYAISGGQQ